MKKIIMVICLIVAYKSQAQLQGVGVFKINKTTISIIDTLSSKFSLPVQKTNKSILPSPFDGGSHITKKMIELERDSDDYYGGPSYAYSQHGVRVFYINYLEVSDVGIEDIYLTFNKDTLIQLICTPSRNIDGLPHTEFNEALNLKYGKPVVKSESKTIYCQNGFGATTIHEERHKRSSWNTKIKNITADEFYDVEYDHECKLLLVEVFVLKDQIKMARIDKIENVFMAKLELERQKNKAKALKDF